MKICVAGATGMAGSAIEAEALARGHEVVAVSGMPDRLVLDDPRYVPAAWRTVARASLGQYEACVAHPGRHWTYLSPPANLAPGHRTGNYRLGSTRLLTDADGVSRITAADLAMAVLDQAEYPGPERHITVAAAPGGEPGAGAC